MGRPRKENRESIVAAICQQVSRGTLVKDACEAQNVTRSMLHRWTEEVPAFRDAYARAREDQAHALAEEALTIADEKCTTSEEVARNRLRVDTRKWLTSKIAPRYFGERQSIEHSGAVTLESLVSASRKL